MHVEFHRVQPHHGLRAVELQQLGSAWIGFQDDAGGIGDHHAVGRQVEQAVIEGLGTGQVLGGFGNIDKAVGGLGRGTAGDGLDGGTHAQLRLKTAIKPQPPPRYVLQQRQRRYGWEGVGCLGGRWGTVAAFERAALLLGGRR